jgi:hypothetical protein
MGARMPMSLPRPAASGTLLEGGAPMEGFA